MPRLIIQARHSSVRQVNIPGPIASIGRATGNRVCLDSERVSRHHAVIQWSGDGYVLTDMGSRNGTYVNDERVYNRALCNGDAITIGDFNMRFLYSSSAKPLPPAEALRLLTMPAGLHGAGHASAPRGLGRMAELRAGLR